MDDSSTSIAIHIDDPWFGFIRAGKKTVEGKLAKGKALLMTKGRTVSITGNDGSILTCVVADVRKYTSFDDYLMAEGLDRTLPGVTSLEDGLAVYAKYFEPGLDQSLGVLAIELRQL